MTIALTPARNEESRIATYIENALLWADHVLIADHNSTDATATIASAYPGVTVMTYGAEDFTSAVRTYLLDECRRAFGADNLLVFVDVDEALTVEAADALKAAAIIAPRPSVFALQWVQLWNGTREYRIDGPWAPSPKAIALLDDGAVEHTTPTTINDHAPRVPVVATVVDIDESLLHFQFLDREAYLQKQLWYQLQELSDGASPLRTYVKYFPSTRRRFVRTRPLPMLHLTGVTPPTDSGPSEWRDVDIRRIQTALSEKGVAPAYWPRGARGVRRKVVRLTAIVFSYCVARTVWSAALVRLLASRR